MNRERTLDDLIGADTSGPERERLQHVHAALLEAGPPPELSPQLEAGPTLGMTVHHRRTVKRRAMLLLAAAVAIAAVFFAGLGVGNHGSGKNAGSVLALKLTGTQGARHAEGLLQVWNSRDGSNWPMTLSVAGLPELGPHTYYEVYLFRDGKIAGSCGTFRVGSSDSSGAVTVTLTSPYQLRRGDSWVVTRPGPGGAEPGKTVLRPITA